MSEIHQKFRSYVKDILNHFPDTAYLENKDLLKIFLSENELSQFDRVQLFRDKIRASVEMLRPQNTISDEDNQWRSYRVISYRYLQGINLLQIQDQLGLSERQIQREIRKGLDALVEILDRIRIKNQEDFISAYPAPDNDTTLSEHDLIIQELNAYASKPILYKLTYLMDDSLKLCKLLHTSADVDRFHFQSSDPNLFVEVDPVLTKMGIYRIFNMLLYNGNDSLINITDEPLNNQLISLSFYLEDEPILDEQQWQLAHLFFDIQGIDLLITRHPTIITLHLPLVQRKRCLVVDDVVSATRLLERMLSAHGVEVIAANDATQAIEIARKIQPDFILLDVLMPKTDGWQVINELKVIPSLVATPIIICSVFYEPELAQAVGAAACIRKPINRIELLTTLVGLGLIDLNSTRIE